jgi:hypothetical protein
MADPGAHGDFGGARWGERTVNRKPGREQGLDHDSLGWDGVTFAFDRLTLGSFRESELLVIVKILKRVSTVPLVLPPNC